MKEVLILAAILAAVGLIGLAAVTSETKVSSKCNDRGGVVVRVFGEKDSTACIKRDVLIEVNE